MKGFKERYVFGDMTLKSLGMLALTVWKRMALTEVEQTNTEGGVI